MNKLNEPYLAGPSGSTSILYINLFKFYSFPETKENKVMLLCVIIADYIPLWHTLSEILLSSTIELIKTYFFTISDTGRVGFLIFNIVLFRLLNHIFHILF